ncbi:MAG TPA: hypothetical protein PLR06_00485 [Cyclobacteriaceae bacterium]|nr:hypothetical protein [Cyclobacteriaceae bacterium]
MRNIKCVLILVFFTSGLQAQQTAPSIDLDVKIGQMILVGIPKAEVDPAVLKEVQTGKVGSIILFEKNIPVKKIHPLLH